MEKPIDVNDGLWEFCKYQNELLKNYKEFIEKTILVKILENKLCQRGFCYSDEVQKSFLLSETAGFFTCILKRGRER